MLKQKQFLTRLREKLEGRKGKLCFSYKKFRHLAQNCRNVRGEEKGKAILQNKFEVLSSWVMQCGVEERAVHMMRPQKAQQEKRLVYSLQRKAQENSSAQDMPPKGATLEERGWKTKGEFVEYEVCEYKGTRQRKIKDKDLSLESS